MSDYVTLGLIGAVITCGVMIILAYVIAKFIEGED